MHVLNLEGKGLFLRELLTRSSFFDFSSQLSSSDPLNLQGLFFTFSLTLLSHVFGKYTYCNLGYVSI